MEIILIKKLYYSRHHIQKRNVHYLIWYTNVIFLTYLYYCWLECYNCFKLSIVEMAQFPEQVAV